MPPSRKTRSASPDHLALNLGVRWDLQTFTTVGLISNPLFPPSGKVPFQPYNFAPRAGFAYSLGNTHPLVVRGGYGIFYVRIPQIYNSVVQTENGITDARFFSTTTTITTIRSSPAIPTHWCAARCTRRTVLCRGFTQGVTSNVSAFASNFVTPRVQQSS